MEKSLAKEGKKAEKRKSSTEIKVSSSDRQITKRKHLQTTSSDEQPLREINTSLKNFKAEIERLKKRQAVIKKKKVDEKDAEKSKNTERSNKTRRTEKKGLENIDICTPNLSKVPLSKVSQLQISQSKNIPEHNTTENQIDEVCDKTAPIMSFQTGIEPKLEDLKEQNEILIQQNRAIFNILQNLKLPTGEEKLSETLYEPLKGFPLTTVAQFKELDCPTNIVSRRKVYDHLLRLGGRKSREFLSWKSREFLSCALKEIMTDELVCKFTWNKTAETESFGNTKVSNGLYKAAKKFSLFQGPDNKDIYKTDMRQVLQATKRRFRNAQRKSLPNHTMNDMAETEEETAEEKIQRKISELKEMLPDSDADDEDEDFDSDNLNE